MKKMGITIFSRSIGLSEAAVYKAFKELGWSRPENYNDLSSEQIEAIKSTKCAETYLSNKAKREAREKELQRQKAEYERAKFEELNTNFAVQEKLSILIKNLYSHETRLCDRIDKIFFLLAYINNVDLEDFWSWMDKLSEAE